MEECTESTDCCSMSGSAKNECLKKQYGANSTEYICATGDARTCAIRIYDGGTAPSYCIASSSGGWNEKAANDCKLCAEQVPAIIGWSYGGFRNYACNGAPANCDVKGIGSGGDPFGCCRVYEAGTETFIYSSMSGEYNDCIGKCGKNGKCPDNVKPGVYMNALHSSLNCWTSCDCPFDSNRVGQTFYGKRTYLKCKNEGKMCTKDEVVWYL